MECPCVLYNMSLPGSLQTVGQTFGPKTTYIIHETYCCISLEPWFLITDPPVCRILVTHRVYNPITHVRVLRCARRVNKNSRVRARRVNLPTWRCTTPTPRLNVTLNKAVPSLPPLPSLPRLPPLPHDLPRDLMTSLPRLASPPRTPPRSWQLPV